MITRRSLPWWRVPCHCGATREEVMKSPLEKSISYQHNKPTHTTSQREWGTIFVVLVGANMFGVFGTSLVPIFEFWRPIRGPHQMNKVLTVGPHLFSIFFILITSISSATDSVRKCHVYSFAHASAHFAIRTGIKHPSSETRHLFFLFFGMSTPILLKATCSSKILVSSDGGLSSVPWGARSDFRWT